MLRGRGRELELLDRLLRDVRRGSQHALVVDGEAGIGKSRLVAEAVAAARCAGFRTFAGAAEPAERGRPFAAMTRLLGPAGTAGELGELLASMESLDRQWLDLDPGAVGFRVTDAIVDLFERDAGAGPVLLVLDDLHWADRPSTELLDSIHRRLAGLPIALLVTVRTSENPRHATELIGRLAAGSRMLSLAPLPDDAVAALAADVTGAPVGDRLRGQLAKAEGNPFFVTELLRALGDEGLLAVESGVVESRATTMPVGLVHTVLRRLRLLPAETLELLRFASILGQSFAVADLARVTRRGPVELVRRLAPALRTHTLRDAGDQLTFGHALTWEAVYHELPAAVRRAVHRETAGLLAEAGVPAVRVARHFVLGAEPGDAEAVSWLRKAARAMAPGSPATAAELFGTALDLSEQSTRDAIVAELAPLLVVIGEVDRANELTNGTLAREVDRPIETKLRAGLTHVLIRHGRVGDAKVQALRLLDLMPEQARELVAGIAGYVLATAGDADRAEELAERALAAGEAAGHDLVIATALMTLTWTYGAHGRVREAVSAGRRAVAATEHSTATMSGLLFPHCPLGAALLQADRFAEADRAFRDGLARADRTSAPGTLVYHQCGLAATTFLYGDWDAALSEAEVALDLAGKTGTSWQLLPSAVIARIAVARDDLGTARAALDTALRAPEAGHTTMTLDWLHWAHAVLLHAAGAIDQAGAAAQRAWRAVPALRDVIGNRIAWVDCVRIALAAGNRALAEEISAELAAMAAREPIASLRATAAHCRGLVDGDPAALADALALLRNTPRRYQWAVLNEDAAVGLGPADRGAARTRFRAALTGYRELGATRDAARVSAAMRAMGLRPGGAPRAGDGTLTTAERTVAGLVAEGLSNPQIAQRLYISRHTAETHMKHIFAKLGLSSRTELAALVAKGRLPG